MTVVWPDLSETKGNKVGFYAVENQSAGCFDGITNDVIFS